MEYLTTRDNVTALSSAFARLDSPPFDSTPLKRLSNLHFLFGIDTIQVIDRQVHAPQIEYSWTFPYVYLLPA